MENKTFESLKRNSDFLDLKKTGQRFWATQWLLLGYKKTNQNLRVGFTVSRKVGNSVTRNRLKRWSREIVRNFLKQGENFDGDINIIFKPMSEGFYKGLSFDVYEISLKKGWNKVRKTGQSNSTNIRSQL